MATEVTQNPESDTVTVTFDSKFRDYTTVREIRLRNRDSLKPTHSLVLPSSFGLKHRRPTDPLVVRQRQRLFRNCPARRGRRIWAARPTSRSSWNL